MSKQNFLIFLYTFLSHMSLLCQKTQFYLYLLWVQSFLCFWCYACHTHTHLHWPFLLSLSSISISAIPSWCLQTRLLCGRQKTVEGCRQETMETGPTSSFSLSAQRQYLMALFCQQARCTRVNIATKLMQLKEMKTFVLCYMKIRREKVVKQI